MTDVPTLLAGIKTQSGGLTDLCAEHLRQSIRHVQRNCDIDCNVHTDEAAWDDCEQPDRYDGARMAEALAGIPRLVAAIEAVAGLHTPQEEDQLWCILDEECEECYPESGDGTGHAMTVCSECRAKVDDMTGFIPWPCPTITAVVAALGGGE